MAEINREEKARPRGKHTYVVRVVVALLIIFFLFTVGSQIYIRFHHTLKTETIVHYRTSEQISFRGVYLRNERVVRQPVTGIIAYTHGDGAKLAMNSVVAKSYASRRDITLTRKIEELNNQYSVLVDAEKFLNTDNTQLESFTNQISAKHGEIMKAVYNGNYGELDTLKAQYLGLHCKKQIVKGTAQDFSGKKTHIEGTIARLNSQISAPPTDVVLNETGYFVSVTDGYESLLSTENAAVITKEEIEKIIAAPRLPEPASKSSGGQIIGKIVDDYKWLTAAVLPTEKTRAVSAGSAVTVRLGSTNEMVDFQVERVTRLDDGTSVYVFSCDRLSPEFSGQRTALFHLVRDNYSGLRIPAAAIRFNDENEQGVFVKNGAEITFRRVNIIAHMPGFSIAENTTTIPGYVSLYDIVVTAGEDLYEGKIVE
ncbi:hypothetical protein FACS189499_09760 [Clostridia bacterium]|nr:hypothetical protein FACS189499_09760 [Clostridia bacterium]